MQGDVAALLAALSGGALDLAQLPADLRAQERTIAELALLWEADVGPEPPAETFSAAWPDADG